MSAGGGEGEEKAFEPRVFGVLGVQVRTPP